MDGVDDVITRTGLAVLRIELDDAGLDDDTTRPEPPGGIPLPSSAIPGEGEPGAPAAGGGGPAAVSGLAPRPRALKRPLLFPAGPPIRLGSPPALRIAASTCFTKGRKHMSAGPARLRARPR